MPFDALRRVPPKKKNDSVGGPRPPEDTYVSFFSSRRRHTRLQGDWSSDVCSSDLLETREQAPLAREEARLLHRRAAREVRARHRDAVVQRAETVADVEPEVPEGIEQLLDRKSVV